jgi:hypothetical protein
MRYGCVNHTTFSTCAADQLNWCTWHEEACRCGMYYDDADFVHLMLWSGTKLACAGKQLNNGSQQGQLAGSAIGCRKVHSSPEQAGAINSVLLQACLQCYRSKCFK